MQSTCQTGSKVMGADRSPRSSTSSQVLVSLNGCTNREQEGELSMLRTKGNVTAQSTLLLSTGSRSQAGASRLPDRTGLERTLGVQDFLWVGGSAPGKAPIYTHWALGERALLSSCVFDDFRLEDTLSQTEMTFGAPRTVRAPQTPLCNPLAFWDLRVKKKKIHFCIPNSMGDQKQMKNQNPKLLPCRSVNKGSLLETGTYFSSKKWNKMQTSLEGFDIIYLPSGTEACVHRVASRII